MRSFSLQSVYINTMKNILLVFTGGTIGSSSEKGVINTSGRARYQLLDLFQQHYPDSQSICFKTIQPLHILSENLQPVIWEKLIAVIEAENPSEFDGIIVTHGTDTLAFSAAALGLYFNHLNSPMLLVSSNYPLSHPEANGLQHFICAVEYIKQQKPAGVFVPYKNPKQTQQVHLATRLASSLQLSGDFVSVQSQCYMKFEQVQHTRTAGQGRFMQTQNIDSSCCIPTHLKANFSKKILLLRPYPGLDYSSVNLHKVDAVLHDCYHSGTACATDESGEQYSLSVFIKYCRQQKIPVYMAPAVKHYDVYDSVRKLIEQGAEMIWNMSLESAYVKLLLAYGNFTDQQQISTFLQQDIALEHI